MAAPLSDRIGREWRWARYKAAALLQGIRDPRPHFTGLLSYDEGLLLARLARAVPADGTIVEIGCYGGLSTAYLLEGSRRNGARVHSIDPFDADLDTQQQDRTNLIPGGRKPSRAEVGQRLRSFGHDRFELIQGFSHDVVRTWDGPIDLLWIDGNHEYQAVKRDYEQWSPFVKLGGFLAFHDANKRDVGPGWTRYGWEGPTRLVKEKLAEPIWESSDTVESIVWAMKKRV